MILQALTAYYESLVRTGKLEAPGWAPAKVGVALDLGENGEVEQAISLIGPITRGKKTVIGPRVINMPAQAKRTVDISANFLCDNSSYMLGFDKKGKPARSLKCFAACKKLHEELLEGVDSPAARTVLAFFESWAPETAQEHPALAACMDNLLEGANITFRYHGSFVHDDPDIRAAWQRHYDAADGGPQAICLVTGERCAPVAVHPSIKGVQGAQSSGAALVSFNAPAFWSYGKEQSLNAPTGKYAAFAYTSALNDLIASSDCAMRLSDTTVLFWAKDASPSYSRIFRSCLGDSRYSIDDLRSLTKALCAGEPFTFEETRLKPQMEFFILGISPNAARLSVRFFLRNSFGEIMRRVQEHYERLEIVRPSLDKREYLTMWSLLDETVNKKSRDKLPPPVLAGELLRAIVFGTRYPATLLNGITLRIRAEHEVTRGRAAILKAYYIQNTHPNVPKEVLHVSLNPDSTNIPYTLGRLFSLLEAIQKSANRDIQSTIKDRYFNSASSTPSTVFPTLVNLAQKHLKKLDDGLRVYYEKQLSDLFTKLGENYPTRMNLAQQGAFQIGYYHQTQANYGNSKKED
ncbi:MAG TPA: type I-C CRISPR-associated protein Cas8c/Csd1 [Candidatus Ventricola intestinavium]|nr:type I-C CRISPR-associated protein Cas8c/Csd1 [Candidatus Ventricola intestinavium]